MKKRQRTIQRRHYLREKGYNLQFVYECEFEKRRKHDTELKNYINSQKPPFTRMFPGKITNQEVILDAIKTEQLFGLVECTISVPNDLWGDFEQMSPIFQTVMVSVDDVGETSRVSYFFLKAFKRATAFKLQVNKCCVI